MAPPKKASPSKAPKKAVTKSSATHPSWTDMIKVLTISTIYSTSLLLLHERPSVLRRALRRRRLHSFPKKGRI